jgi:serine/threonine-protein kinase
MIATLKDPLACPDENALSELVQGLLDAATASLIEVHLDRCVPCRQIVSSLGRSSYLARRQRQLDPPGPEAIGTVVRPTMAGPAPRRVGELLAGKYQVERVLGEGGMGVVMAARHLTLGKLVAIKLMRPDLVVDPSAILRFVREARAASTLRSEHIVRVIDLDTLEDGAPYIAMEYLEGEDLGTLVSRGPISVRDAATCIAQVTEALAEAHAAGIVHRDLKPANLFVTRRGDGSPCMKVLDFGVSKILAGGPLIDDLTATDTKTLIGSPHYMAPEQLISAKAVDPRTDIWALGCILFELVTGRAPFAGTALAQVLAGILRDEVPPLTTLSPQVPTGFAAIVTRCLEKDPACRFQHVADLTTALASYVGEHSAAPASQPDHADPRVEREGPRRVRSWQIITATALVVAASLAVGHAVLADRPDTPLASPAGAPTRDAAVRSTAGTRAPPAAPPNGGAVPSIANIDAGLDIMPTSSAPDAAPAPPPAHDHRARPTDRLEDDLLAPKL